MPFIDSDKIIVPPDRYRTDFSSVEKRAEEIASVGQFQPILVKEVDGQLILIDGECRLRACELLNRKVWYTTNTDGQLEIPNEYQHRLLELMANTARQDMTPLEKSRAIADLDSLMKQIHGQSGQSSTLAEGQEGWSADKTASLIGYTNRARVQRAIYIAKAAETMPELSEAKTESEAVKMIDTKVRLEAQQELAKRRTSEKQVGPIKDINSYFSKRIIVGDCIEKMRLLSSGIASIFLTDPPFGVNLDDHNELDCAVQKGGSSRKIMGLYKDDPDEILNLLLELIPQISRVGRPSCFVYMFCAFQNWHTLRDKFVECGFNVYHSPMYWVRGSLSLGRIHPGSRCTAPAKWPMKCVYCILFASRGDIPLARQGQPDVIVCDPVVPSTKIHSLQLPIPLLTELISRVHHPETRGLLIDLFCGSGSSLAAALHFPGLDFFGYEKDPEFRERSIAYLINYYTELHNPKVADEIDLDLEVE